MESQAPTLRPMWLEEFAPFVGRKFLADCAPKSVALTLIEAVPLRYPGATDRQPFSLLFHSGPDTLLVSGLYALQCDTFGPELVHLAPIMRPMGSDPGYYYEAIFN